MGKPCISYSLPAWNGRSKRLHPAQIPHRRQCIRESPDDDDDDDDVFDGDDIDDPNDPDDNYGDGGMMLNMALLRFGT